MGKGSKSGTSHQLFKDKAKNRVDDLQGMFSDLQSARKESRTIDVAVLEEQVHQMLREWQAELSEPSPASSLQQEGSLGLSDIDISRLLQRWEEEDDATSSLAALKPDPDGQKVINGYTSQESFMMHKGPQEQSFTLADHCKPAAGMEAANSFGINNMSIPGQINGHLYDLDKDFDHLLEFDGTGFDGEDIILPPPSAFLGPKCALWDCPRPALGLDWCQKSDDYCSSYHANLARSEVYPGCPPIVRPSGIGLKDNLLFAALGAKSVTKEVGIPECEGAATAKSPWNAPELFDLTVLDGETLREWLFFDKPRRAFESGNRKQRSLPDYKGRGWHESRKQVMKEFGGLKRSYYMDPQPVGNFEWHLFEYEINKYDAWALYRLEAKRAEGKRIPKGKSGNDSVADLQKQMIKLTAEVPNDNRQPSVEGRGNSMNNSKGKGNIYSDSKQLPGQGQGQGHQGQGLDYGLERPYDDLFDNIGGYY